MGALSGHVRLVQVRPLHAESLPQVLPGWFRGAVNKESPLTLSSERKKILRAISITALRIQLHAAAPAATCAAEPQAWLALWSHVLPAINKWLGYLHPS